MADKKTYPQIPSTVWWGVRSILQRSPNTTVDERLLAVQLGVQEAAARAYVGELRNVGILTEDGKASPLALKWRLDESYPNATKDLIEAVYPEQLVQIAPPGEAERQKVVSWFQHEGLGLGAAGNKAATYLLLSSPSPNEAPRSAKNGQAEAAPRARASRGKASSSKSTPSVTAPSYPERGETTAPPPAPPPAKAKPDVMPLNVNVQIHISADAGTEQIESIFQAMRRYLYDAPTA